MYDDVVLFAIYGMHASAIIKVLQYKYPEKYIHTCNIYNLVQTLRYQNQTTSYDNYFVGLC
ncbi:hypothetical protein RhiirA5_435730 [Rhizophagus irregularis]|uniref:Uncharacterized protein n=1 Tax=Rhizophagus irregularis TaxID=588596 RepID=A0A2N0NMZ4_9GLOM|nr:hypothetical protein RhiirA5_435730 [Rhizophagus irregularis]PKC54364.1 hypothetical protein RhiirA1_477451 [Rhizophagus irregularis]GET57743.1 hypothetical protein GLOIN_2v1482606 [Rhizophagus irregularis DAOM 181602=DAOM 197198]